MVVLVRDCCQAKTQTEAKLQNSRNENLSFPAFVGKLAIRSAKRYILVGKNNQNKNNSNIKSITKAPQFANKHNWTFWSGLKD